MNNHLPFRNTNRANKRRNWYSGFTLIELLATLTIIAIMAAALLPVVSSYTTQARTTVNQEGLATVQEALDRYLASDPDALNDNGWGLTVGSSSGATNRYAISIAGINKIMSDISIPGPYQTLRKQTANGNTFDVNTVALAAEGYGPYRTIICWRYRNDITHDGVDRAGNDLIGSPGGAATNSSIFTTANITSWNIDADSTGGGTNYDGFMIDNPPNCTRILGATTN